MNRSRTAMAVVLIVVLAGCSSPPVTSQDITIDDTTDLDCDNYMSEVTVTATVSVQAGSGDIVASIAYLDTDGEMATIEQFEVNGYDGRQVTVDQDDLGGIDETKFYIVVEEDNLISNNQLGTDNTERVAIESAEADQPIRDPDLTFSPEIPSPGESVEFNIRETVDHGCTIDTVEWDFTGDGTTDAEGKSVTYTFSSDGYHKITKTVVTTSGVEFTNTGTVLVTDDDGEKFRYAADPVPQSTLVPQAILQLIITVAIAAGVFVIARYR